MQNEPGYSGNQFGMDAPTRLKMLGPIGGPLRTGGRPGFGKTAQRVCCCRATRSFNASAIRDRSQSRSPDAKPCSGTILYQLYYLMIAILSIGLVFEGNRDR
jgi:hypothetical protein